MTTGTAGAGWSVLHCTALDACLLPGLPAHRLLDALTLIDEAGQRRDGAREVFRAAAVALALVATCLLPRARTTDAAELVTLMPAELGARLGEDARFRTGQAAAEPVHEHVALAPFLATMHREDRQAFPAPACRVNLDEIPPCHRGGVQWAPKQ